MKITIAIILSLLFTIAYADPKACFKSEAEAAVLGNPFLTKFWKKAVASGCNQKSSKRLLDRNYPNNIHVQGFDATRDEWIEAFCGILAGSSALVSWSVSRTIL